MKFTYLALLLTAAKLDMPAAASHSIRALADEKSEQFSNIPCYANFEIVGDGTNTKVKMRTETGGRLVHPPGQRAKLTCKVVEPIYPELATTEDYQLGDFKSCAFSPDDGETWIFTKKTLVDITTNKNMMEAHCKYTDVSLLAKGQNQLPCVVRFKDEHGVKNVQYSENGGRLDNDGILTCKVNDPDYLGDLDFLKCGYKLEGKKNWVWSSDVQNQVENKKVVMAKCNYPIDAPDPEVPNN